MDSVMTGKTKRVRIETTILLPEGVNLNSATLLARITEALESLSGGERVRIETLKYDPG